METKGTCDNYVCDRICMFSRQVSPEHKAAILALKALVLLLTNDQ